MVFMPLGVPKVPYRISGEESAQWVDLYNRLYRDRIVFLCQDLNDEISNQLIAILIYLNAEEKLQDICLYINSAGGSVSCGMGIYDAINYIESDVTTIGFGAAASMSSLVLAGGTYGKRFALPSCRIMIHQPSASIQGQASVVLIESDELSRVCDVMVSIYAERTGQTIDKIYEDIDRDYYMSAHQAKTYGLIDQVAVTL